MFGKHLKHKLNCQCGFCRNKYGKNNPAWLGGLSFEKYSYEFDNNLKEKIRFRDQYKCRICRCSQLENGEMLSIHHIDYNKKNNNINNLVALCRKCHCKTTGNRDYWYAYCIYIIENKLCLYI